MTTTKEDKEEVTELVPVTENKKRDAKHVKMEVSANADRKDVNKDVISNAGSVATVTLEGVEKVNKDVITNADSVSNKPAAVATSKAKADINIEDPGPNNRPRTADVQHRTAPAHTNPYDITTINNESHQYKRHRLPESSSC